MPRQKAHKQKPRKQTAPELALYMAMLTGWHARYHYDGSDEKPSLELTGAIELPEKLQGRTVQFTVSVRDWNAPRGDLNGFTLKGGLVDILGDVELPATSFPYLMAMLGSGRVRSFTWVGTPIIKGGSRISQFGVSTEDE